MQHFATHDPLPDNPGRYTKVTITEAVQMPEPFSVTTLEGTVKGRAGDWLAKGIHGELYPIADEVFQESYVTAGDISPDRNPTPSSSPLQVSANP